MREFDVVSRNFKPQWSKRIRSFLSEKSWNLTWTQRLVWNNEARKLAIVYPGISLGIKDEWVKTVGTSPESRPPFLSGLARDDHDHPGGAGVCLTWRVPRRIRTKNEYVTAEWAQSVDPKDSLKGLTDGRAKRRVIMRKHKFDSFGTWLCIKKAEELIEVKSGIPIHVLKNSLLCRKAAEKYGMITIEWTRDERSQVNLKKQPPREDFTYLKHQTQHV